MSLQVPSDDELLRAGDADSFALFYRRHAEWVLAFLSRRTRDPELAGDLCAEVFAAAYLARGRYQARDGRANSWLFRIALNKLNDSLRRGYAEDRARRRLQMEHVEVHDDDREYIAGLAEDADVMSLVDELPPDQRAAVRARVVEELDYEEIAERSGVSEAVVRKRVSRGISALRQRLRGDG